jgi:Uma2 family endonuclease
VVDFERQEVAQAMADKLYPGELPPELMSADRPPHPRRKLTWEEFLDWCNEDANAEWVDGEVVMHSPVHERHDELVRFLQTLVSIFVRRRRLGEVRGPQFLMHIESHPSGREPDLLFLRSEHLDRLRPTFVEGPADVVVEVVSDESVVRDRGEKFLEYEEARIPEYWLLDPKRRVAEFYRLGADGRYQAVLPEAGVYRSAQAEGLFLRTDWLWQEPLPDALDVLGELGVLGASSG